MATLTQSTSTVSKRESSNITNLFLIRHAETYRNAEDKEIQGWIDDAAAQLNDKGTQQAEALRDSIQQQFPPDTFAAIYTSPLTRCVTTAEIINEKLNVPLITENGLKEICHGQHDTMSFKTRNEECEKAYAKRLEEFQKEHPRETPGRFFKWAFNPLSERAIPKERKERPFKGELQTVLQVYEIASAALEKIAKKNRGQDLLLVTHAGVIRTLADEAEYRELGDLTSVLPVYYEKNPPGIPSRLLPGNCSVQHFVWDPDKKELYFKGTIDLVKKLEQKV